MKEKLRQLLAGRQRQRIVIDNRIPSAVLVPIFNKQGHYYILFIRRTETVKVHKGQISFPGGTCEADDHTLLDTALRESYEEIGLYAGDADILGGLDDEITTTSNYIVSPFIATIPFPYRFKLSKCEVSELIEIPVAALLDKNNRKKDTEIFNGEAIDAYTYYYEDTIIWGATARILNQVLDYITRVMSDS